MSTSTEDQAAGAAAAAAGAAAEQVARRTRWIPSRARPASLRASRRADAEYGAGAEPDWRQLDFDAAQRTLEIEERSVNVIDIGHGDGPPVLFIHGLGGSWRNWLENIPAVAEHRRVVAVDLPGFGESEPPKGEMTISSLSALVDELCERLELGQVDIVGNSMGGFVGADIALTHPQRVHRLVLVDAAGISIAELRRWPSRLLMRFVVFQARWAAMQRQILLRPRLRHFAFRTIMRHPTRVALDLVAYQAGGPGMPGFLLAMDALLDYDFRDRLGDIACPTLIVHGEQDMLVPVEDAWSFRKVIPNSRVVILPDTGHVPMFERPRRFNRLLSEFLEL